MQTEGSDLSRGLLRPPFVLAVLVLGAAVFGVGPAVFSRNPGQAKEPIALRKPLREFDKSSLGPYRFAQASHFSASVQEALGTDEYINWTFVDSRIERKRDPLRYVNVHVAYYTGGRDLVPHTPDNCIRGAGYQLKETGNIRVELPTMDGDIPVRAVTAEKSAIFNHEQPTVIYTFHCNGELTCTRSGVRLRINSLKEKYAYFCKVEVSFGTPGSRPRNPTRDDAIAAAGKFLNRFLPVLIDKHLPDWEALSREDSLVKQKEGNGSKSWPRS